MKIPTRERDALKRHDMREARQRAQARLNRAAVAWAEHYSAQWHIDISREKAVSPAMKLLRAVRAFQKFNATQTKGNK